MGELNKNEDNEKILQGESFPYYMVGFIKLYSL